ncbi:MAG: AAA family ATPase [Prevotellaceae bacterium]|jgi:Holliday junction resolvasome RuvABC ATP-dependent DNA helicase subunit|nr:AAA family ATPase [Prevotellaceae bacterium]
MNCPKCNKPNRDAAVYCKSCGETVISKKTNALQDLVGLTDVKNKLQDIIQTAEKINERAKHSGIRIPIEMDMVISGKSGTGKSKLVEVIQQLLFAAGLVKNPKPVIIDAVDWEKFSDTAKKDGKPAMWEENVKNAKGGLLIIDNAQKLIPQKESDDINKLDRLFADMEKWHSDPIVILVGLPGLRAFMASNPEIAKRFEHHFSLKDYTESELVEITDKILQNQYKLGMDDAAKTKLTHIFKNDIRHKNDKNSDFQNAHSAVMKSYSIFENVIRREARAVAAIQDDVKGTEFHRKTYDEVMAELNEFVGVDEIRSKVEEIIQKMDLEVQRKGEGTKREIKDHFLFLGNPGTGKTTIARVFADILNAIDVLPTGQLVEVAAKDLIAGYVGQTALATEDAVDSAMGGILFIDEAYDLNSNSFGKEAINTLLKLMEDRRGKFVCIAAGYSKEMADFIATNSGLSSRFNESVNFHDYKPEELTEIFTRMAKKEKLSLDPEAEKHILNYFRKIYIARDATKFGNAREARNVLDKAMKKQAVRVAKLQTSANFNPDCLNILTREDIEGEDVGKEKDLNQILAELDEFIGMTSVKKAIRELANKLEMDRKMMERGLGNVELTNVHIVLTGNPGTGKTTIAKKLGEIFKAINLLPTAKLVEKESKNLKSSYMNDTAKLVDKAVDEAMGGILFIDEAYSLTGIDKYGNVDKTGEEAVASLITRMSNDAGKFVLICAGYKREIDEFIDKGNPGFKRRFTHFLHIEDYSVKELMEIFLINAKKQKLRLTDEAKETLQKLVQQLYDARPENWGNAGEMTKLLDQVKNRKQNRLQRLMSEGVDVFTPEIVETIETADIPFEKPKELKEEEIFAELNELVGLGSVKTAVREIAEYIKVERAKAEALGKKYQGISDHYLFVGNPGTGKTTVARIMANVFYTLGVLPTNKLVEVTRKDLVAGTVGNTAPMTARAIKSAVGGVFFIDEAYALSGTGNDFGQEATDTMLPMMLDYKGKMVFIAAGYPREMQEWINSNSGLESRFTKKLHFEDYKPDELSQIFLMKAAKDQLSLTPEAETAMRQYFANLYANRGRNFANAREVNNYFEKAKKRQSARLLPRMSASDFSVEEYKFLTEEDFING